METKTRFVLLMHPKEFRKTKNGTGHLTHNSLPNSEMYVGIDFTKHKEVQAIINDEQNECFMLYPHEKALKLNHEKIKTQKNLVIFIVDSTWPCSRKILRVNPKLQAMKKISFENESSSKFYIKTQPNLYCLSTIESTLFVIRLLNNQGIETITNRSFEEFLQPFEKMVEYQLECAKEEAIRYK